MARYFYPGKPPAPPVRQLLMQRFLGVDLTSAVVHIDPRRSPHAPNMMPDADGYPSKRTGYHTICRLQGTVYASYALRLPGQKEKRLVHAGRRLYVMEHMQDKGERAVCIYEGMAQARSCAVQLKGKLWILDGERYLYYDGERVDAVSSIATVPVIAIAKGPRRDTGATSYQPVNLLTGKRTDSFAGTQDDRDYFLSFGDLVNDRVHIELLNAEGVWSAYEGRYEVERVLGRIRFDVPPGKSPLEGEDNVRITYEVKSQEQCVNACSRAILYGVNGTMNRIFMTGDPERPNVDRWSAFENPAYIADIDYSCLGSESCEIVGYSVTGSGLAAHKCGEENGRNIFIRQGVLNAQGDAEFLLTDVVQAEGAVAQGSFQSALGEPMFLTQRGVCALTGTDGTGERYAQCRSFFINGALAREQQARQAAAQMWGRFYVLSFPYSRRLYLMDTEQKAYDPREPQSSFQLECYVWEGIEAVCLWTQNERLRFGTTDGRVCEFWPQGSNAHYMDCDDTDDDPQRRTRAVKACWTTPLMNLGTWANLKTVTGVWVVGQPYSRSGGEIFFATDKTWQTFVRDYYIDIFDWNSIDFNRWTFHTMDRPMAVNAGRGAKRVKLFQVCVKNERDNEPFGLFAVHINYRLGSRVRR